MSNKKNEIVSNSMDIDLNDTDLVNLMESHALEKIISIEKNCQEISQKCLSQSEKVDILSLN